MHKAYDRVVWQFLARMMIRLGFSQDWVDLIVECVSSVQYQVRINNELSDVFVPTRGLRQGDPLSPYLFLLCVEGLSALLSHEEQAGNITGVRVCRAAPPVSHLLFAYDSLILMRADQAHATCLRQVLQDYCAASGQLVSEAKSAIFFSPCTPAQIRAEVCTTLNIMAEAVSDKYLGLPPIVGVDRSGCFQHLVERVLSRIRGWKEKLLSVGGREILLKAVIQAIPSYAMSVFKLPKEICNDITSGMSKYWWGDDEQKKHMHWFAWWKMCVPKEQGGMGFRDIHCFNLVLLAKQSWRLLCEPDSLCGRVLRARYYPDGDLLNCQLKKRSSYTWQSIWHGLQTFKKGIIWRVGDGSSINIWNDPWISSSPNKRILTPRNNIVLTKVSELIDVESRSWDEEMIRHVFWPVDAERILTIPLVIGMMMDFMSWYPDKRGSFFVKSAYHKEWEFQHGRKLRRTNTHQTSGINPIWKTLWKLRIPSKVKIHVWKSLLGAIPCYGVLANRHIKTSSQCPLCTTDCESIKHLFFQCPQVVEIWRILGLSSLIQEVCTLERDGSAVLQDLLLSKSSIRSNIADVGRGEIIATAVWYIWWERRQATNGEKVYEPAKSAHAITALAKNFYRPGGKKAGGHSPRLDTTSSWSI
uniref:Reverse transcriptase domain-containing protein n=1 Tax=Hordeum vulgare subsp. vulgare TaxID=112509 RepID=A0A8I6YQZ6_HORVV